MAGCGRSPAPGRRAQRPDHDGAYRRHEGIEPTRRMDVYTSAYAARHFSNALIAKSASGLSLALSLSVFLSIANVGFSSPNGILSRSGSKAWSGHKVVHSSRALATVVS